LLTDPTITEHFGAGFWEHLGLHAGATQGAVRAGYQHIDIGRTLSRLD
jgi:hypothetical protein